MICLAGSISIDIIQKLLFRCWNLIKKMPYGTHYLDKTMFVMVASIAISLILGKRHSEMLLMLIFKFFLGLSRIVALYKNYHAPLDLMMELNRYPLEVNVPDHSQIHVCFGKEWHRYPGSFFLPNKKWNIHFIKSEFDGMLPAPYSSLPNATKIVHEHFNDQNREEPSLYYNINHCHFLLDLDLGKETDLEPNYAKRTNQWKVVASYKFLNAEESNKFARAFYIPFLSNKHLIFGNFTLMQSIMNKIK